MNYSKECPFCDASRFQNNEIAHLPTLESILFQNENLYVQVDISPLIRVLWFKNSWNSWTTGYDGKRSWSRRFLLLALLFWWWKKLRLSIGNFIIRMFCFLNMVRHNLVMLEQALITLIFIVFLIFPRSWILKRVWINCLEMVFVVIY